MAQINDFQRYTIFAKLHGKWREDESGRCLAGKKSFFQLRPALKSQRLELGSTGYLLVNEIGNRTGEMTRDRQKPHSKRFVASEYRNNVQVNSDVDRRVQSQ